MRILVSMIRNVFCLSLIAVSFLACVNEKEINYLNQSPPGTNAALFAPGLVSTEKNEHSTPAFSPDGSVVVWTVSFPDYSAHFFEMTYTSGKWSEPVRPSFCDSSGNYYCPSFSRDGRRLYFTSNRKVPFGYSQGADQRIWQVERTGNGWTNPIPFDTTVSRGREFSHSMADDGTLYFSASNGERNGLNIFRSEVKGTDYAMPSRLAENINSDSYNDGPCIAPDGSYLIFESDRPGGLGGTDLYVSFLNEDKTWGTPVNLGAKIDTDAFERFARLSPDGKFLFFASSRNQTEGRPGFDIFWIEAAMVEELR